MKRKKRPMLLFFVILIIAVLLFSVIGVVSVYLAAPSNAGYPSQEVELTQEQINEILQNAQLSGSAITSSGNTINIEAPTGTSE